MKSNKEEEVGDMPEIDEEVKKLDDSAVEQPVVTETDENTEELKSLVAFMKDLEDPESAGLELSDEEKKGVSEWITEMKKEMELQDFRDFLRDN